MTAPKDLSFIPIQNMSEAQKGTPMSVNFLLLEKIWRLLSLPKEQVESRRNTYHDGLHPKDERMLI